MKVLVVLGNRLLDDGGMSNFLKDRLLSALTAWESGEYGRIVVTGGIANPKAGRAEGDVMFDWLVGNGVPQDRILVENRSRTTKENAKNCKAIFADLGVKKITLLSSAYHIDRKWLNPVKLFKRYAKVDVADTIRA